MMMVRSFDRRWLAAFAGLACVTTAFALMSGPSRAATKSCKGTPAVFLLDTNLSNNIGGSQISKDLAYGYRAATAAINKTCQLGRPIKFIACDDKVSPNGAADCGRRAVAAKAFGVSSYTGFGENFTAPVVAAKIPLLPFSGNSATESTSPLSYPFGDSIPIVLSALPAAKALGAKKLAYLHLDVPSIGFLLNLVRKAASHFGIQIVSDIPVPLTATDMTHVHRSGARGGPAGADHDRRSDAAHGDLQAGRRPGQESRKVPADLIRQRHESDDDREPAEERHERHDRRQLVD